MINPKKFKSDIRKFRISLIILTILYLSYILLIIGGFILIVKNGLVDIGLVLIWILLIICGGIILWICGMIFTFIIMKYERKNMKISKDKNSDNFKMIMFTSIIGYWLWLPNKKEIEQLIQKNTK